jgi:outer membrane biosynthesis protein TonB
MTDIERYEQTDTWVPVLADVGSLAAKIADTDFVPGAYRGKPAAVAASILYGRELGLGPMTSLAAIDPIKGTPSLSAEAMRALIFAAGHDIRFVETTETRCVLEGRRKGQETWTRVAYTMDEAKKSGDAGKNQQYRTRPQEMMVARATSRLARMLFPEAIGGFPSPEEVDVDHDEAELTPAPTVTVVQEPKPKRAPAKRKAPVKTAPKPAEVEAGPIDEPPLPGEDGYEDLTDDTSAQPAQPEPPKDEPSPAMVKALHAALTKAGYGARADKLRFCADIAGRDLESSKDLTRAEVADCLDALQGIVSEPADAVDGELVD